MQMSESAVRAVLERIHPELDAVVRRAWERWNALPAAERATLKNPRSFANCVWSLIAEEAQRAFRNRDDVRIDTRRGTLSLIVQGAVMVRFKKLSRSGRAANYPTQMALDFAAQLVIPGMEPIPRVWVGYVLDDLQANIARVVVACPNGNRVAWMYAIEVAEPAGRSIPLPMNPSSAPPAARARVKRDAQEERNVNKGKGAKGA